MASKIQDLDQNQLLLLALNTISNSIARENRRPHSDPLQLHNLSELAAICRELRARGEQLSLFTAA